MEYRVVVYTGDRPKAGTDANVKILFHDENGTKSPEFKLAVLFRNDFERGEVNNFEVTIPANVKFGKLKKIEFWRDTFGLNSSWHVDRISVQVGTDVFQFPVFRWIKPHHHYLIQHLDTSLPQFDEHKQQRQMELENKRKLYQLKVKNPGLPPQVAEIPADENFATDYRWDLKAQKYHLGFDTLLIKLKSGKWKDLESLKNIYVTKHLPEPKSTKVWTEDSHFGKLRVADINPVLIKLCAEIPDKFGVTDEMVGPFLEGLTMTKAIAEKRLFIVDMDIMDGVPGATEELIVCAPLALFFETSKKQLMPVAIQLFQNKSPDNPVFLPSDPPMTWLLAKMWFNNADSAYHQALTHLGFTHLIMEGISVITHRNLSQSHPIFKLLAPHFLYLIAINKLAVEELLSPGGWVDSVQGTGVKGNFHLIAKGIKKWRINVEGTLPEELRQRGLLDPAVLSYYPYRDDALLVYEAIRCYVEKIVNLYYDSPDKLADDYEIQTWAKELVKPRENGGCGMLGVPGNGHFTSNDQLVLVFTSVISTCSVAHAAFNFPQYDSYGFPPNYPLRMTGIPPKDKTPRTEADIVDALPDKSVFTDTLIIVKLLSQKGTNSLGDFEVNFAFDPKAVEIVKTFKRDLADVSATIKERNKTRHAPYEWLQPELIPNSISI